MVYAYLILRFTVRELEEEVRSAAFRGDILDFRAAREALQELEVKGCRGDVLRPSGYSEPGGGPGASVVTRKIESYLLLTYEAACMVARAAKKLKEKARGAALDVEGDCDAASRRIGELLEEVRELCGMLECGELPSMVEAVYRESFDCCMDLAGRRGVYVDFNLFLGECVRHDNAIGALEGDPLASAVLSALRGG